MITRTATLRRHTNISDAPIFRAEIVGQDVDLAHRFQRRLAGRGGAEDSAVGTLSVEGEIGAIALPAQKLEVCIVARPSLRDVGIEIKK